MDASYLFLNKNCLLLCEMPFFSILRHSKLTYLRVLKSLLHAVFITFINHFGKFAVLYKLILIVVQMTNQIKNYFSIILTTLQEIFPNYFQIARTIIYRIYLNGCFHVLYLTKLKKILQRGFYIYKAFNRFKFI